MNRTAAYMPLLEAVGRLVREGGAARSLLPRSAPTWFAQLAWLIEAEDRERLWRELLILAQHPLRAVAQRLAGG